MATYDNSEDRTIYITFNDIFQGFDAGMRKRKSVRRHIQTYENRSDVRQLIQNYGLDELVDKVRGLLIEGIFESTLCASMRFPELFEVSQAQTDERAASEAAAAAQQAQTLEQAVEEAVGDDAGSCGGDSGIDNECPLDMQVSKPPEQGIAPPSTATSPKSFESPLQVPSLFPIYLPFAISHRILVRTQSILEAACFRFASETIPEVLHQRGWDCPEATELNVIVRQLLNHEASLHKLQAATAAGGQGSDLAGLSTSITKLRHATVHRGRLTARVLEGFLVDAEAFAAGLLDDGEAAAALGRARRGVERTVVEMENNKSMLETRLRKTLDDIAARRAELDRLEKAAVADALRADAEHQGYIGRNLEESLEQGGSEESDVGDASDDAPGLSEAASASGGGGGGVDDDDDMQDGGLDDYETEGEDDCFEDAQENDSGVFLTVEIPGIEK